MKREADPNRSAASAVSLPLRVRLRRLPSLSSFTNGPRRAHSPCYRLHARPQLLYQPLPFQLTQRERAGQRRRRWRLPPPRRREGAREGGRSETRHLKLAPTKTTTTAAGRSRERADGRTADGRAGVLELPKPSELVQKISSFTAAAAAAFGAANYRAERAWVRGGRESGAAAAGDAGGGRAAAALHTTSGRRSLS